ncbi:gp436 family protein [Nitrospirillum viridazoti]|uniref:Phage gp36-like protein n=1 Tax=Nitrospirillum amazonense TaxID=28077 RepID=A0A560INE9_9PROT|nr:DUF1320 domain-containing protein [Nitrospirillum amazonense]TWB58684.1 phage gp36-like protein [Nitrospirillum amazonense]
MPYATLQDMVDRYGSGELRDLTDRDGTAGQPVDAVAGVALTDASQMIDGYLVGRYQLPLSPVPQNVVRWTCDIARFFLWKDQASDAVKTLYTAAVASLVSVQRGTLTLEAGAVEAPQVDNQVVVEGPGRMFPPGSLRGF